MNNSSVREIPIPGLSNTLVTNYTWLFKFQVNLIKLSKSKNSLSMFQVPPSPMRLAATILDSTNTECFPYSVSRSC